MTLDTQIKDEVKYIKVAKSLLRLEARKLRKRGISVKKIEKILKISRGTASRWTRDIILSIEQLEHLRQSSIKGAALGRLRSAFLQKERRLKLIEDEKNKGIDELSKLTERELLISGLALYWGEGSKKDRRIEFCNSDPRMIEFFIYWLHRCFNIKTEELRGYLGINEIHLKREETVKLYWSKLTQIPLSQFRKTYFKKTANKKIYENFNDHYGTLNIRVAKSAALYYKIMGLIEGLAWQRSSMVEQSFHKR